MIVGEKLDAKHWLWVGIVLGAIILAIAVLSRRVPSPAPFVSPISPLATQGPPVNVVYLPLVVRNWPPDLRFGINLHRLDQSDALGFPPGDRWWFYHWDWHRYGDSLLEYPVWQIRACAYAYVNPAHSWQVVGVSNDCLDGQPGNNEPPATTTGWWDEAQLRTDLRAYRPRYVVIGNELAYQNIPVGKYEISDELVPWQYAAFYDAAYTLIKEELPNALVMAYGPIGYSTRSTLEQIWSEYYHLTGSLMPTDRQPLHRYAWPGSYTLQNEIDYMETWIGWLEERRGSLWESDGGYWLTEYGMPSWEIEVPVEDALLYMGEFTSWLKTNDLGIERWAWWADCELRLVSGGARTPLGDLYHELATTP